MEFPYNFGAWRLSKGIVAEFGDFIAMSSATMSRSRMDVATIFISSVATPIHELISLKINNQIVALRVFENHKEVEITRGEYEEDLNSTFSMESNDMDSHSTNLGDSKNKTQCIFQGFDFSVLPNV